MTSDLHLLGLPELGIAVVDPDRPGMVRTAAGERHLPWRSVPLDFHDIDAEPVRGLSGLSLPPVQSRGIALIAAGHLIRLSENGDSPVLVENTPHPRAAKPGELDDARFLAEVARCSGCGVLLDLDRPLSVPARSRRDGLASLAALPLERVVAVRVGWPLSAGVFARLAVITARLPRLRALIIDPPRFSTQPAPTLAEVESQLARVWARRGRVELPARARGARGADAELPPGRSARYPEGFSRSARSSGGRRQRDTFPFMRAR